MDIYGIILPIDFHMFQDGWNHQADQIEGSVEGLRKWVCRKLRQERVLYFRHGISAFYPDMQILGETLR